MAQVSNNQQKQEVERALFEVDEGAKYISNAQIWAQCFILLLSKGDFIWYILIYSPQN